MTVDTSAQVLTVSHKARTRARASAVPITAIADRLTPTLRRQFLAAMAQGKGRINITALAAAFESGSKVRVAAVLETANLASDLAPILRTVDKVFAAAATWTAGNVAETLNVPYSFDLTNPQAVAHLERYHFRLIREIDQGTREGIRQVLLDSFTEGIPPLKAARRIREIVGLTERQAAAVTAYEQALIDDGLGVRAAGQKAAKYGEKLLRWRGELIARTECLPAQTLVDAAVVGAVYRRWYDGDVVQIRTRNGREFTATPNHPMFTHRGWVGAGLIHEGDYVVCDRRHQHASPAGDEHVATPPATIAQIFDAAATVGVCEWRSCADPDFHGDGRKGQVDIASPFWLLEVGRFTALTQPLLQAVLAPSDLADAPCCLFCGRLRSIDQRACLCLRSQLDAMVCETSVDQSATHAHGVCDVRHGFASGIARADAGDVDVVAQSRIDSSALVGQACGFSACSDGSTFASHDVNHGRCVDAHDVRDGLGIHARRVQFDDSGVVNVVSQRGRFGERALLHSGVFQPFHNDLRIRADSVGDGSNGHAAGVELDRVIAVTRKDYSGHVYNLSTPDGYFTINRGIYTGNTIRASSEGQQEAWQEAARRGVLDRETTRRVWLVADDDRLCEDICAPMADQEVGLDEPFTTGDGQQVMTPPAHPACRCSASISRI